MMKKIDDRDAVLRLPFLGCPEASAASLERLERKRLLRDG
jgi:hypothetical protein